MSNRSSPRFSEGKVGTPRPHYQQAAESKNNIVERLGWMRQVVFLLLHDKDRYAATIAITAYSQRIPETVTLLHSGGTVFP